MEVGVEFLRPLEAYISAASTRCRDGPLTAPLTEIKGLNAGQGVLVICVFVDATRFNV